MFEIALIGDMDEESGELTRDPRKVDVHKALQGGDMMEVFGRLGILATNEEVDVGLDDGTWGGLVRAFPEPMYPEKLAQLQRDRVDPNSKEYKKIAHYSQGEYLAGQLAYKFLT